jgi:hypothetical protein
MWHRYNFIILQEKNFPFVTFVIVVMKLWSKKGSYPFIVTAILFALLSPYYPKHYKLP